MLALRIAPDNKAPPQAIFPELSEPHWLLASPANIELSTAQSIHLAASEHVALSTGKHISLASGDSMFASIASYIIRYKGELP